MNKKILCLLFLCFAKNSLAEVTTPLPVSSPNFTTPGANSDPTVAGYSNMLFSIIQMVSSGHQLTSSQQSSYFSTLNSLKGRLIFFVLNENDTLLLDTYSYWYTYVISRSFATDSYQSAGVILGSVGAANAGTAAQALASSTLQSQVNDLQSQADDLKNKIATIKASQEKAKEDLNAARQSAFATFSTSDLFMRGRLGVITNNSSIAYQLVASDGSVLDTIAANSTSSNTYDLSDSRYANTELGSMFKLVPYDAKQIEEGTALGMTTGGTVVVLCNTVGTNQPGNPYGYSQEVTISRVYPSAATRAHAVDIGSLVADSQYWQIDFEISPLGNPSSDDASVEVIFPRISMIQTVTESLDVSKDLPGVLDATMDKKTAITRSNSSSADSYPSWTDTPSFWTDLPS